MLERARSDVSDEISWWCPQCKSRKTIRDGSFFNKPLAKSTAIDVYQWFREVCSTALLSTPVVLGGNGVIVEIDESLFRHKPKVYITIIVNVISIYL